MNNTINVKNQNKENEQKNIRFYINQSEYSSISINIAMFIFIISYIFESDRIALISVCFFSLGLTLYFLSNILKFVSINNYFNKYEVSKYYQYKDLRNQNFKNFFLKLVVLVHSLILIGLSIYVSYEFDNLVKFSIGLSFVCILLTYIYSHNYKMKMDNFLKKYFETV